MKNYFRRVGRGYEVFCQILLLMMSSLVIVFVFLRYMFNVTFVWAEELITMLFISTTYFGAVMGMKYSEHINIGFFHEHMPPGLRKYVDIFNSLVILGLQIAITKTSMDWIAKVGNNLADGLRIPMRYFYYMMPFSAVVIGGFCIFSIVMTVVGRTPGDSGRNEAAVIPGTEGA